MPGGAQRRDARKRRKARTRPSRVELDDAVRARYVADLREKLVGAMIARAVDGARDGTLLKSHKVATAAVSTLEEAITTGILSALVEQANEVRAVLDAEHVRLTKVVR